MARFLFFRLQPIEILKPFFILVTVKILTIEKLKKFPNKISFEFFIIILRNYDFLIDVTGFGQSILLIGSWI